MSGESTSPHCTLWLMVFHVWHTLPLMMSSSTLTKLTKRWICFLPSAFTSSAGGWRDKWSGVIDWKCHHAKTDIRGLLRLPRWAAGRGSTLNNLLIISIDYCPSIEYPPPPSTHWIISFRGRFKSKSQSPFPITQQQRQLHRVKAGRPHVSYFLTASHYKETLIASVNLEHRQLIYLLLTIRRWFIGRKEAVGRVSFPIFMFLQHVPDELRRMENWEVLFNLSEAKEVI